MDKALRTRAELCADAALLDELRGVYPDVGALAGLFGGDLADQVILASYWAADRMIAAGCPESAVKRLELLPALLMMQIAVSRGATDKRAADAAWTLAEDLCRSFGVADAPA